MTRCQTPGMCSPFGGCPEKIPGLPEVKNFLPIPACKPPRSESGLRPIAYIYTCRNPGQASLLWAHQPPPFGHGWIDIKRVGLVREDEVEALRRDAERYRWLRANQLDGLEIMEQFIGEQMEYVTDEELDAYIDSELLK